MSTAKPMKPVRRAVAYLAQNSGDGSITGKGTMTPKQRRRIRHKNHKMLGAAGGGTVKPRQVKTRQARPAPVAGGLLKLLSPSQMRKAVGARSARKGIRFKVKSPAGQTMIIDDMQRMGSGDR
jgi:hypothetical protein